MYVVYVSFWLVRVRIVQKAMFFRIYLYFSLASPYPIYLLLFPNPIIISGWLSYS